MNRRSSFVGRKLFDALRASSEDALLGFYVLDDAAEDAVIPPELQHDAIRQSTFRSFNPTLMYFEGGLGGIQSEADPRWRIPRPLLEDYVREGAVVIIADVDAMVADRDRELYEQASGFIGAAVDLFPHDLGPFGAGSGPVYAADPVSNWGSERSIVLRPETMQTSRWLAPVFEGVEEIVVGLPAVLRYADSILLSGNRDTTGTLQSDAWIDRIRAAPIASVSAVGLGYVVFIAAAISSDVWSERPSGNTDFLVNCARFLHAESRAEEGRRSRLRDLQAALQAARAAAAVLEPDEAGDEVARQMTRPLELHTERAMKAEVAREVERQLTATFSPDGWRRLPGRVRRYLITADVLRTELESYRSVDPDWDFSTAIVSYSQAVEAAVTDLVFDRYRNEPTFHVLPSKGTRTQRASAELLRKYVDGKHITLGQMARCLANVGCELRGNRENGFARFLQVTARDADALLRQRLARSARQVRRDVSESRSPREHDDAG